jgi:hypothetical protein
MGAFEEIAAGAGGPISLMHGAQASDPDYVVVRTQGDLERLCDDISGEREDPIVGLTFAPGSREPVLRVSDVRDVVGSGVRIYLITSEDLLRGLAELVGSRLRVWEGAVRTWWPGASVRDEPGNHPVVVGLEDEDYQVTLEEFATEFDLSRPRVRGRVRLIEDSRAFLERELRLAQEQSRKIHERLRDSQIESHRLRTRAEVAEASLEDARRSAKPE